MVYLIVVIRKVWEILCQDGRSSWIFFLQLFHRAVPRPAKRSPSAPSSAFWLLRGFVIFLHVGKMSEADIFGKLSRIFETHAFSRDNPDYELDDILDELDPLESNPAYLSRSGSPARQTKKRYAVTFCLFAITSFILTQIVNNLTPLQYLLARKLHLMMYGKKNTRRLSSRLARYVVGLLSA